MMGAEDFKAREFLIAKEAHSGARFDVDTFVMLKDHNVKEPHMDLKWSPLIKRRRRNRVGEVVGLHLIARRSLELWASLSLVESKQGDLGLGLVPHS